MTLLLSMAAALFSACGSSAPTVTSIEVSAQPEKTEYRLGEAIVLDGGMLTVNYSDNTTQTVSLDADGVTIDEPNMKKAGKKSITVHYGGMRARMNVVVKPIEMTFENYRECKAPKRLVIIDNAPHARSSWIDPERYEKELESFWNEYDSVSPAEAPVMESDPREDE